MASAQTRTAMAAHTVLTQDSKGRGKNMFDAEDLKDEGFNLEAMTAIAEQAIAGISGKSKEAKWLEGHLE